MTKRVQLDISRESPVFRTFSVIEFHTNFKISIGNLVAVTRAPLGEYHKKAAGDILEQAIGKFLSIEGCNEVQSPNAYSIRVYPTTAMNDGEYMNFLRQAVSAFVEVYGPIDEFVLSKQVARDLQELFAGWNVPSTDGDRVFVTRSDVLPAATVN